MATKERIKTRRMQVERCLASDMAISDWCKLNRVSESTMYRWMARFRKEASNAPNRASDWIFATREDLALQTALAPIDNHQPSELQERWSVSAGCDAAATPIRISINNISIEVSSGTNTCDITSVLRAVVAL